VAVLDNEEDIQDVTAAVTTFTTTEQATVATNTAVRRTASATATTSPVGKPKTVSFNVDNVYDAVIKYKNEGNGKEQVLIRIPKSTSERSFQRNAKKNELDY
jgi:hypothetical protein